jgi:hypothetical protein
MVCKKRVGGALDLIALTDQMTGLSKDHTVHGDRL